MNWVLIYFAIKYKGDFSNIYNALKNKEVAPIEELEKIKINLQSGQIKAITIVDDDYPESLKQINKPPFVLFYEGNKKIINDSYLVFTGEFTNDAIDKFVDESAIEIAKQYSLVSCAAKPMDYRIINKFLQLKRNVIVVLPNGTNNFEHEIKDVDNNLLIISECPNDTQINKKRIHQRNRLAIGLSTMLIIASSYKKSSIMNLVTCSLDQGKDVYCYPGLQNEFDGNNLLIQDGAHLITSIKSVK